MTATGAAFEQAQTRSRVSGWLTLISAVLVLTSMLYASWRLSDLAEKIKANQAVIDAQKKQIDAQNQKIKALDANVNKTQSYLLDFLGNVTSQQQVHLADPTVKWPALEKYVIALSAGERKRALMVALLYAWKDVPFKLGGQRPQAGLDSPSFLQLVLAQTGITFQKRPGELLSAAMMRQLRKVDTPLPGDLAFYHGQVGSFGFLILEPSIGGAPPVGIGTLQQAFPLEVLSLDRVNTSAYPLIGYYRVSYPDE